jgi:hypothetical protein
MNIQAADREIDTRSKFHMSLALKNWTIILSNVDRFPSKFQILSKFHMSLALKNWTVILSNVDRFPAKFHILDVV